jgi:hypothetical protein
MTQIRWTKIAIAISTFAGAALLSFGWSEQRGLSLSVESAEARIGRPGTPLSVAGVARRQNRRAAYAYGAGVAGAGLAAGYGYYRGSPYAGTGWGNYGGYGTSGDYGTYGGYPGAYTYDAYSSGVWANRSYVTGRPTLIPRYYGGYGYGQSYGNYGQYYGNPNNRGGLVGGPDPGTYRP